VPRNFSPKPLRSTEAARHNRYTALFAPLLHHPNLWPLNRHSVAGGVAIGLFAGLVPGPFQMLTAAILAVPLRVNLPVALATTLYTNPLTIGPLYVIAYWIGTLFVHSDGTPFSHPPGFDWSNLGAWLRASFDWMLSLGKPLAVGLVVLAVGLAIAGYAVVQLACCAQVMIPWRRPQRRRAGSASGEG